MVNDEYLKEEGLNDTFFNYILKNRNINSTISKSTFIGNYLDVIGIELELFSNIKVVIFIHQLESHYFLNEKYKIELLKEIFGVGECILITLKFKDILKIKRDILISNILNNE